MKSRAFRVAVAVAVAAALVLPNTGFSSAAEGLQVRVLSNRADLVSGGDALVEVVLPSNADPAKVRVDDDGRDVTSAFAVRPDGRFTGLVSGLGEGANTLTARGQGGAARLTVTNHPKGGPVFAGQQVQPWFCHNEDHGLGKAVDAQCNTAPVVRYQYKDSSDNKFKPYDPANPPPSSSVASTTTDQGRTVPYIVRLERGVINRGTYELAVLADPAKPFSPFDPAAQPGWNRKLFWSFGGDCAPSHVQGRPAGLTFGSGAMAETEKVVARGFLGGVASNTVLGENCNTVSSAETLMMLKERIVESYGPLRYTMSEGCSGGSMQQNVITSAYPGLLHGIIPSCSFPDFWILYQETADCHLLNHMFDSAPEVWTPTEQAAVAGNLAVTTCRGLFDAPVAGSFTSWLKPDNAGGCLGGIPAVVLDARQGKLNTAPLTERPEWVYHPETNPKGVRCTIQDYNASLLGRRPSDGFANRPYDNVGVQYGLQALLSGQVSAEKFVSLNERIGGLDIDANVIPQRSEADSAVLDIMYRTGQITDLREQRSVPVIDLRAANNAEAHNDFHSYVQRARLDRANGGHGNQIMWTGVPPLSGDPTAAAEAIRLLDRWLTRIEADDRDVSKAEKVVDNKPRDAVDACWINGDKITDMATCRTAFPYYADPRLVAGASWTNDVIKCRLRPLDREEYYGVTFTDDQWSRLRQAFPDGVCDYRKPAVGQQPTMPWLGFTGGPGGRPLGPAPTSISVS